MNDKPVLVSGVKPTGDLHIGNYFGAMRQFVELTKEGKYRPFIFVADYHALNTMQDAEEMRRRTREIVMAYIAVGLDPKEVTFFKQSDVPAHTELAWIFDAITTMPYLMRAHAFKDAEAKNKELSVGKFNYPILMAASILLYDTKVVPVGADQKQHVEYARDIALKFNHIFGPKTAVEYSDLIFKLPEALILEHVAIVPGIDGRKMSKSYGNTIPLFASREEIEKAVMSIVTDSGKPEDGGKPMNVYNIHKLFKGEDKLKELYEMNKGKYQALKHALIEDIDAFIKPMRLRRLELAKDPKKVLKILEKGGQAAKKIADKKLEIVKKAIGVL